MVTNGNQQINKWKAKQNYAHIAKLIPNESLVAFRNYCSLSKIRPDREREGEKESYQFENTIWNKSFFPLSRIYRRSRFLCSLENKPSRVELAHVRLQCECEREGGTCSVPFPWQNRMDVKYHW